jgi:reactive intermediate/imine deaminase
MSEGTAIIDGVTTRRNIRPAHLKKGADHERGYSYGVQVGNMLWVSGQIPKDAKGDLVGADDIEAQAVQVMENLKGVIEAAGGTMDDVVKISTYVTDRRFRDPVQAVRRRYFRAPNFPASATTVVDMLLPEVLVEVEAVVVIGSALPRETT